MTGTCERLMNTPLPRHMVPRPARQGCTAVLPRHTFMCIEKCAATHAAECSTSTHMQHYAVVFVTHPRTSHATHISSCAEEASFGFHFSHLRSQKLFLLMYATWFSFFGAEAISSLKLRASQSDAEHLKSSMTQFSQFPQHCFHSLLVLQGVTHRGGLGMATKICVLRAVGASVSGLCVRPCWTLGSQSRGCLLVLQGDTHRGGSYFLFSQF